MIGVINLGNSNLLSLLNSLSYLNIKFKVIENHHELGAVDKIILPGVGSFGNGASVLKEYGYFDQIIHEVTEHEMPIIGICLGMQLLFKSSEESPNMAGLGLLDGEVIKLPPDSEYSIPRIGWAESHVVNEFLGEKTGNINDYYYIHSYCVKPSDNEIIAVTTDQGITACVKQDNIYGCQFHPEKSHTSGMKILSEFGKS
ncbi:MAG: imidazole glycerol phosphate synthase subunit HisH [Candidatus Marinimicrobia bacterium]|nr:imidazole glycerol phosphate synthase subunit HisH [Candidatus Neomarinimicrobiota bacterium]